MSEFKGKWEVFKPEHIGCINVSIGENTGFNPFIELWHHQFENKEQCVAAALLISKAPELLEMLNRVRLGEFPYEEIRQLIKESTEL